MKLSFKVKLFFLVSILFFLSSFKIIGDVKGWFLAGSAPKSYDIGTVVDADRGGKVAYLKSVKTVKNNRFGTIMQSFNSEIYKGKKIKLTGYIKTNSVKGWVGMWLRIDGEDDKETAFDNMRDRKITGSTLWTKYEIILDVGEKSSSINYGVLMSGEGHLWLDDLSFEVVDNSKKATGSFQLKAPTNSSFDD